MNIPVETKPVLWGVAGGAVAMAIAGFSWGGWVTGGKAEAAAQSRAETAVLGVLAPFCADKFRQAGNPAVSLAELRKVDSWSRGDYIEKGGWATLPGGKPEQVTAVAKACADLLVAT